MGILGDVLDLGSAVLGAKGDRDARNEAKWQFHVQQNRSIQNRVRDAEKAGIHPIFAMGASVGSSPTAHVPGGSAAAEGLMRAGRNITARAQTAIENARADKMVDAQAQAALGSAARDEALAQETLSNLARSKQNVGVIGSDVIGIQATPEGVIEKIPSERKTLNPKLKGTQAGVAASTMQVRMPNGEIINAPASDEVAEAFSAEQIVPYYVARGLTSLRKFWRDLNAGKYRDRHSSKYKRIRRP